MKLVGKGAEGCAQLPPKLQETAIKQVEFLLSAEAATR